MQWYLRRVHGDHSARMIRTLLIASLATLAATEAEPKADADPYLIYGGYPYTHGLTYGGYHPYYTLPVVKAAEDAEVKAVDAEEKKTVVPLHYGYGYGYPFHHYYGKREAEAEPAADAEAKADPWLAYSGYAGYAYGHHGYPVVKTVAGKTVVSPIHYYGKRSADAEPAADADPWLAYGYHGYGHGLYRPYGYRSYWGGYPYGGYRYGAYGYYG